MPRLGLGRKRIERCYCDPSEPGVPCYNSYEAKTSVECVMVSEKTMQKRDLELAKRSNASQMGSQGPYIANGQIRRLCDEMLQRVRTQKAGT